MADILQEAYGAPPYNIKLKSFRSDHKQTLHGRGKFGKNDVKFQVHGMRPQLFLLYSLIIHSSMNFFSQHSRQFVFSFFQVFEA